MDKCVFFPDLNLVESEKRQPNAWYISIIFIVTDVKTWTEINDLFMRGDFIQNTQKAQPQSPLSSTYTHIQVALNMGNHHKTVYI